MHATACVYACLHALQLRDRTGSATSGATVACVSACLGTCKDALPLSSSLPGAAVPPRPVVALSETVSVCVAAGRAGLLVLDISGGKESRRIPVFNQVDVDQPPTDLEYIRYPCMCITACLIVN